MPLTLPLPPSLVPAPLQSSALTYRSALAQAGGREVDALMRHDERVAVCAGLYASPPYDLQVPALPQARLSITLTAAHVSGGLDGECARHFASPRHALFLTPPGAPAHWRKTSPSRHVNLYFHRQAFAGAVPEEGVMNGCDTPLLNGTVPGLRALVDELVAELEGDDALAAEAVDCLSRLLLVRVARHLARSRVAADPLSPGLLATLREHVEAHLSGRILVQDMAQAVGLTPNRFAQADTQRTGQAPHQFVLQCRLDRATALLQHSRHSIAEVAAQCGFASQQHLTHTMRQKTGITPGRLRQGKTTIHPGARSRPEGGGQDTGAGRAQLRRSA
jgi:AraC family transcriptional regulator